VDVVGYQWEEWFIYEGRISPSNDRDVSLEIGQDYPIL
jgi:hypothetical protein